MVQVTESEPVAVTPEVAKKVVNEVEAVVHQVEAVVREVEEEAPEAQSTVEKVEAEAESVVAEVKQAIKQAASEIAPKVEDVAAEVTEVAREIETAIKPEPEPVPVAPVVESAVKVVPMAVKHAQKPLAGIPEHNRAAGGKKGNRRRSARCFKAGVLIDCDTKEPIEVEKPKVEDSDSQEYQVAVNVDTTVHGVPVAPQRAFTTLLKLSSAQGDESIKEWLQRYGLAAYADKFIEAGFDDLALLAALSPEEKTELFDEIGLKLAHKFKLRRALAGLTSTIEPNPIYTL